MTDLPNPPEHLGPAGRQLWVQIHDDLDDDQEFDQRELVYLDLACAQTDDLARVEADLAKADLTVRGSQGQPVPNGLLGEAVPARTTIATLLARLGLGDTGGGSGSKTTSESARHAALVRHHGSGRTAW